VEEGSANPGLEWRRLNRRLQNRSGFIVVRVRIRVICEGKIKNANLRELDAEYAARIRHFADLRVEEVRPVAAQKPVRDGKLRRGEDQLLARIGAGYRVLLDPRGREYGSDEFAAWLGERQARGTAEVTFVVGGPDGFSEAFRSRADLLLALSRMTLTRDWARALLLEQIYRAFTILRGHPYAR
jgi:23S rRNA (pseudouridine1915-N3)-methyltransferase